MSLLFCLCFLLISPTYGESVSETPTVDQKLEWLRMQIQELSNQREQDKQEMRVPVILSCSFQSKWNKSESVITFENDIVDFQTGGGYGGMDLESGRLQAGPGGSGYYTVTYSGYADLDGGEWLEIDLYHNGVNVGPQMKWSSINGDRATKLELGSRTTIIHLKQFDYLELRTGSYFTGQIRDLTFCVSLPYGQDVIDWHFLDSISLSISFGEH